MGGRLSLFTQQWDILGGDKWVLETISQGYKIEFTSAPPSGEGGRPTPIPTDPVQQAALEGEVSALLAKRAIVEVSGEAGPLFRSSLFLTQKRDGSWRPILNLKPLNKNYVEPKRFRMETLNLILPLLRKGMWAASVDLQDAYLHIPIHPRHQRYLAFQYAGRRFTFRSLPFGLSTAPRVFTRVAGTVIAYLRKQGVTLYAYLDDWLIVGESKSSAAHNVQKTVQTLQELGWIINQTKSQLTPTQTIQFLGARLDLTTGIASPSEQRIEAVRAATAQIISSQESPTGTWLRALGLMSSLVDVVTLCRLRMRPLQLHLRKTANLLTLDQTAPIRRSEDITPHLQWWHDTGNWDQGVPFTTSLPNTSVTTDASLTGWGAHWKNLTAWGTWSTAEKSWHINSLEMLAVKRALESFHEHLKNTVTTVFTDSTTVVAYINRQGGTHSERLCQLTWEVLMTAKDSGMTLRASHIAGKLNVMADALSRGQMDPNEWALSQKTCNRIFEIFGKPMVDLFATAENTKLQIFCSRQFHPRAHHIDAMSFPWNNLEAYAFPPLCMIGQVLRKIRHSRGRVILIAPFWPRRPWFGELLQLLMDTPAILPDTPHLLSQRRGTLIHPDIKGLQLVAWKLSGLPFDRGAFRKRLPRSRPTPGGQQPLLLTIPDYASSGNGATTDRYCHPKPLWHRW